MKEYKFSGQVTVSCHTIVKADSFEEALEIAYDKDVELTGKTKDIKDC